MPGDPELFRGTGRGLSFVANASSTLGGGGAVRYRLQIEGVGERRNLVLVWRVAGGEQRVVVLSAREISLAYARLDQSGRLLWTGDWLDHALRAPHTDHLRNAHTTATIVASAVLLVAVAGTFAWPIVWPGPSTRGIRSLWSFRP